MGISVRVSLASPEADLAAAVRPGVSTIILPNVSCTPWPLDSLH